MKKRLSVLFFLVAPIAAFLVAFEARADSGPWLPDASFFCPSGIYILNGSHGTFYADIYSGTFPNGTIINGHLNGNPPSPSDCNGLSTSTPFFVVFFPASSLADWRAYNEGGGVFPNTGYAELSFPNQQALLEAVTFGTSTAISLGLASSTGLYEGLSTSTIATCQGAGNILAEGICTSFQFLFVPNTQTVSQFATLTSAAKIRVPFSYVFYVQSVFSGIATTSSANFPLFKIPLSSFASSTITGHLPDIELSTTTISTYLPDAVRLALQALITASIWLAVGWHVYHTAMRAPPS